MEDSKIEEVEGIGPANAANLAKAGIQDTDGRLEAARSKGGRANVAKQSGVSEHQILKWTNMADRFRVEGVDWEYAELLESAGVDTVAELATRNAANPAAKMKETNDEKKLTRTVPSEAVVQGWIDGEPLDNPGHRPLRGGGRGRPVQESCSASAKAAYSSGWL